MKSKTFVYIQAPLIKLKIGVNYVGKIPIDCIRECDEVCHEESRLKSDAMKYAEFAAIKALEDVGT